MKKILKYRLPRDGEVLRLEANVLQWLEVHEQNGWPHIWAIVDEDGSPHNYEIVAWGTGWEFPDDLMWMSYLGTCIDFADYVWHYFMRDVTPSYETVTVNEYEYNPYDYNLSITGSPLTPYSVAISCGDADSAISTTNTKVYNDYTTSIDNLQSVVEQLTAAVATGKTAAVKACT